MRQHDAEKDGERVGAVNHRRFGVVPTDRLEKPVIDQETAAEPAERRDDDVQNVVVQAERGDDFHVRRPRADNRQRHGNDCRRKDDAVPREAVFAHDVPRYGGDERAQYGANERVPNAVEHHAEKGGIAYVEQGECVDEVARNPLYGKGERVAARKFERHFERRHEHPRHGHNQSQAVNNQYQHDDGKNDAFRFTAVVENVPVRFFPFLKQAPPQFAKPCPHLSDVFRTIDFHIALSP